MKFLAVIVALATTCFSQTQPSKHNVVFENSQPATGSIRHDTSLGRTMTMMEYDAGPMETKLRYVTINKTSSMKRRAFVINDSACPVELRAMGLEIGFRDNNDVFTLGGTATAQDPVSAVEIRLVMFDLWGDRMQNLAYRSTADIPKSAGIPLTAMWWRASISDVEEFMTSVAYVRRARTIDGRIWRYDENAIVAKLANVQLKISQDQLESATK